MTLTLDDEECAFTPVMRFPTLPCAPVKLNDEYSFLVLLLDVIELGCGLRRLSIISNAAGTCVNGFVDILVAVW